MRGTSIPADRDRERLVFVIMPFVKSPTRNKEQLTSFFLHQIKAPIEAAVLQHRYRVIRSDESFDITEKIIRDLYHADIVIADLSGEFPNPNVMYELGVRLALSTKPVILIREVNPDNKSIFDVSTYYVHSYDPFNYRPLEEHLVAKLGRFEAGEEVYESPVRRVLRAELAATLSQTTIVSPEPAAQRRLVLRGVRTVESAVARALGPAGMGVSSISKFGPPEVALSGPRIAAALRANDAYEQAGLELMRRIADAIERYPEDGSKTALLLASRLMHSGADALEEGFLALDLIRGMEIGLAATITHLQSQLQTGDDATIAAVAKSAARNEEAGEIALEISQQMSVWDVLHVEDGDAGGSTVSIIDGMHFDRGYDPDDLDLSPTPGNLVLNDVLILLTTDKLAQVEDVLPALTIAKEAGHPLIIIAEQVEGAALHTLLLNSRQGAVECVPVKPPGFGPQRAEYLDDIAIYTGATLITPLRGHTITKLRPEHLGTVATAIITRSDTRFIGGSGNGEAVRRRAEGLRVRAAGGLSDYDTSRLLDRAARLAGKTITVRAGGRTPHEIRETRYSLASALKSALAARRSGAIAGGGAALMSARTVFGGIRGRNSGEDVGIRLMQRALEEPLRRTAETLRLDSVKILASIPDEPNFGLNATTSNIEDLVAAGVLDSYEVIEAALRTAVAHAKEFLQTGTWSLEPGAVNT